MNREHRKHIGMLEKQVGKQQLIEEHVEPLTSQSGKRLFVGMLFHAQQSSILSILLCTVAFVLCVLLSVAPLARIPDPLVPLDTFVGTQLTHLVSWLPKDFGLTRDAVGSQVSTSVIEFTLLIALEFVIYGICALIIKRQLAQRENRQILRLIWLGAIVAGCIYVLIPGSLSDDILVYASYGRLIAIYHANPYFVPLSAYPLDPFYVINYWATTTAAYGPVWLIICAFWGLILSPQPVPYFLAFRAFALAANLCNIWLVTAILRKMKASSRTVILGTLLYAWNPLVLFESGNGGHNDIFMVTFILLGILLSIRAEESGFTRPRNYLPPLFAFTLAVLVKFTTLPIILFFILALAFKTLHSTSSTELITTRIERLRRLQWRPAIRTALSASAAGAIIALLFYGPFWIFHSFPDIIGSFTSPPSANHSEFSIQRAIIEWYNSFPVPPDTNGNIFLQTFLSHDTWSHINIAVLAGTFLLGAIWLWSRPTTHTVVLASLTSLGALLIVTPWFYSWYVTWLVALAAVCLPGTSGLRERALVAFVLTFSISAFATYLFLYGYPPLGKWLGFVCLTTIGPPLLALLAFFVSWYIIDRTHTSGNRQLSHVKN